MTRPYRTTSFASIAAEPVRWAWRGRIPVGKITLLEGDGAAGKSTFTTWLAARVSAGDLDGDLVAPADVIIISAEDGAADTVRPRLAAQGAVLERVHQLHDDDATTFTLPDGLERLRRTIVSTGAKLVIIDPVASFLGTNVSITSDASVRRALGSLKDVAEDTESAIILVRHLNGQRRAPAYRRGLGGAALANIARAVIAVALHPEDGGDPSGRRVVAMTKCNLAGRNMNSVEFSLDDQGRVVIGAEVMLTADELLATQPRAEARAGRLDEAIAFLRHGLNGHDVQVTDLEEMARAQGISERTLNRARAELGLRAHRVADRWWLSLTARDDDGEHEPPSEPPEPSEPPVVLPVGVPVAVAESVSPLAPAQPPVPPDDAVVRFGLIEIDLAKGANTASGTLASPADPAIARPTKGANGVHAHVVHAD